MRRRTRLMKQAAVESLTLSVELVNRPTPTAREHAVVMLAAHAFEMLLKAVIFEERGSVNEPGTDETHSLGRCINIALSDMAVRTDDRAVLLALKQDRDAATHSVVSMSEELLWVHLRTAVDIFDRVRIDALIEHEELRRA